ncbi:hypothetical protein NDU88_001946 [Pleurodeles waltl]|uniref:Secreted protein n=1 Tax=Pleurodeles waltl TaxID=8319 RepID=A0AAV7ML81_PLEWA|nr:hypothetical protein NDU88_001946 [Pleurodeles waltl]
MLLGPGRLWGARLRLLCCSEGASADFSTGTAQPLSRRSPPAASTSCSCAVCGFTRPRGRLQAEYSRSASRNAPGWRNSPADEAAHGWSPAALCAAPAPSAPAVPAGVERPIHK